MFGFPLLTPLGPGQIGLIPERWLAVGILGATYALLALGMNTIAGWCGQWILGYAGFFGIGAYAYAFLNSDHTDVHLGAIVSVPVALGIAILLAILIGLPSLRIRGDYFAVITLAFGVIVQAALANLTDITGGNAGFQPVDPLYLLPKTAGPTASGFLERYYLGWLIVALVWIVFDRIRRTPLGRAWVAIREDEEAARAVGKDSLAGKIAALSCAAGVAALAGVVFAASQQALAPATFNLPLSFLVVTAVVVGGIGSSVGAVLGAIFLLVVPEIMRDMGGGGATFLDYQMGIYGAAMVAVILWKPAGLISEVPETLSSTRAESTERVRVGGGHLTLTHVTAKYGGVIALNDVSLELTPGEIVGMIGPNGSGKTTLLNVISGFHPLAAGNVAYDGEPMDDWTPNRRASRGIGRTFQMNRLFEGISNAENILVAADTADAPASLSDMIPLGNRDSSSRARASSMLGLFPDRFPRWRWGLQPRSLSYANRRRLEMARSLATAPRLLLLDEPTAGMNPVDRQEILLRIRQWADTGLSVLVVEHHLGALAEVADRLVALDHGSIIADGIPTKVLSSQEVVASLMSLEPS